MPTFSSRTGPKIDFDPKESTLDYVLRYLDYHPVAFDLALDQWMIDCDTLAQRVLPSDEEVPLVPALWDKARRIVVDGLLRLPRDSEGVIDAAVLESNRESMVGILTKGLLGYELMQQRVARHSKFDISEAVPPIDAQDLAKRLVDQLPQAVKSWQKGVDDFIAQGRPRT